MKTDEKVRIVIVIQYVLFILGASVHSGGSSFSYEHSQAMKAETIIAFILTLGLIGEFTRTPIGRKITLGTQIIALIGTLVGLTMIIIGIGPRSTFDFILHAAMICSLVGGILIVNKNLKSEPHRVLN